MQKEIDSYCVDCNRFGLYINSKKISSPSPSSLKTQMSFMNLLEQNSGGKIKLTCISVQNRGIKLLIQAMLTKVKCNAPVRVFSSRKKAWEYLMSVP